ncbi:hypothetical protein TwortDSMZ_180 [Staphylococcus phage Twort]|uniref:ORF132 n=2 Tax=Staphylococcus phage Twort (strain DSM 17442 / HER 48) TaxID=2908167 RepID=Q4Z967_BPTWO|nr:ORF132 [Staphylococcus phage Twort]AAX92420.1 ORF132 [Staphylococcus phage Twort]QIW89176.1 hypothetical protein TwortDSMZ_180 [Staphylococcus phage Twort]
MVKGNIKELLNCICGCVDSFMDEGKSYVVYSDKKVFVKYKGVVIASIEDDVVHSNVYQLKTGTIEKQTLYTLVKALQYLVSLEYREREDINI